MQTQEQLTAKKKNPTGKIIAIIAILLVVAGVASCACNFNNQDQVTEMASKTDTRAASTADYDGEAISTEQVNEDSCFTVSEAIAFLEERGFSGVEVEASYDMSGTLLDDSSIAQSGSERYPSYYTAYAASDDSVWVIYIVGKTIMANPLQANLENDTYYLLSESNTVNTYIPAEGVFEVNVPDESKAIVKAVDRIDSTTLDNTTYSVIQEM